MTEFITHQNVPRQDLARWVTRLTLIRTALYDARFLYNEGWGEGGQDLWYIAERNDSLDEVVADPVFALETIRQLDKYVPSLVRKDVLPKIESITHPIHTLPQEVHKRPKIIGNLAAQIALKHCDIFKETEGSLSIPDDAYAGLAYFRADIDEPFDRIQHERLQEKIEPLIRHRDISQPNDEVKTLSIYSLIPYCEPKDLEIYADTKYEAWWAELQNDFGRIDKQYPPSGSFGTAPGNQNPARVIAP